MIHRNPRGKADRATFRNIPLIGDQHSAYLLHRSGDELIVDSRPTGDAAAYISATRPCARFGRVRARGRRSAATPAPARP
jgi:hypothetical protein